MDDNPFDVVDIFVVFQSLVEIDQLRLPRRYREEAHTLQQAGLFTQIGDPWSVVVREHLVADWPSVSEHTTDCPHKTHG